MKKVAIIIVALILVGGAAYYATKKSSTSTKSSSAPTESSSNNSSANQTSANTITFDGSSFSPSTITVASGATVTIKNTSSDPLQMDSNPHPVHTDDTDLNVGTVAAGQSQTFTVTKKGTFGYHNHLSPSETGTITVN